MFECFNTNTQVNENIKYKALNINNKLKKFLKRKTIYTCITTLYK